MAKRANAIPVNTMADKFSQGISVDKINIRKTDFANGTEYEEARQPHRDEGHTFHIVEKGTVVIEIDFKRYTIQSPSVVYMHPNQVHRILDFEDITVCSLAISNDNLNTEYLQFLEEIVPAKPMMLTSDLYSAIEALFSLCFRFANETGNRLYHLLLKDSCNALAALIASAFLNEKTVAPTLSRMELLSKSFKKLLEQNYRSMKRPGEYASLLHVSTHYLNESVKHTTGVAVSQQIQQRNILEAKRLLYHTDQSVKEIAFELGYEDHTYFSKLFTKATGMTAMAFRNKRYV